MPRANHDLMEREFAGVADSSSEDADMRALYDAICKQKNLDEEQKRKELTTLDRLVRKFWISVVTQSITK